MAILNWLDLIFRGKWVLFPYKKIHYRGGFLQLRYIGYIYFFKVTSQVRILMTVIGQSRN